MGTSGEIIKESDTDGDPNRGKGGEGHVTETIVRQRIEGKEVGG